MAASEGPQAPPIPEGAPDPPAPQAPPGPPAPLAPNTPQALQAPQQPIPHMPPLNWSHLKPKFSGKPDEDAKPHLLRTNNLDGHS